MFYIGSSNIKKWLGENYRKTSKQLDFEKFEKNWHNVLVGGSVRIRQDTLKWNIIIFVDLKSNFTFLSNESHNLLMCFSLQKCPI